MLVSVAYSEPAGQIWLHLEVPEGAVVRDAIERSGILQQFPWIDLATQKVGIFGRLVKLDTPLRPGDRVEIYRPIRCDPQTVPRREGSLAEHEAP
ncbi:MAG: RnfH family protein [Rhodocyclaceae bacterium]|nr:RnfH family protein [Rhodocyclaceae bacterium]